MADIEDVIRTLEETADQLEQEIPVLLLEQQVTAKSLVQDRVQETGKDAKGKQLGEYSDTKVPAFFFFGVGKKSTDAKLKKLQMEGKGISYSDFRRLDGKQNKHVDLTFTGRLWRETGLKAQTSDKKRSTIIIGQTSERSEKIAGYLEKRYGNFLALNSEEIAEISENLTLDVEEIINTNLGSL